VEPAPTGLKPATTMLNEFGARGRQGSGVAMGPFVVVWVEAGRGRLGSGMVVEAG